jgi:hypothetical protein
LKKLGRIRNDKSALVINRTADDKRVIRPSSSACVEVSVEVENKIRKLKSDLFMPGQGRPIEKKESPGVGFWLLEIGGASMVTALCGAHVIAFLLLATTVSAQDMLKDQPPLLERQARRRCVREDGERASGGGPACDQPDRRGSWFEDD